jgi:hypothetical protein
VPRYIPTAPDAATPHSRSRYWADADPAYLAHQEALGRDTSEYRPDIRAKGADVYGEQRARAGQRPPEIHWTGFEVPHMSWYERLLARLRGWDA